MVKTIHYGFGKDYLQNWGVKEALREIYQNFLDYGEYEENIKHLGGLDVISISNAWQPDNLDFLRIGNSKKNNVNAIGKHGEGVKMAFLILLREGYKTSILTKQFEIWPETYLDDQIGECFCLRYEEHGLDPSSVKFTITLECEQTIFEAFKANVITADDVIFDDNYYGQLVNKPEGNIYSGGLFVANVKGIKKAYNIRPAHLPLDRDRSVPQSYDLTWATSNILQKQGKLQVKDLGTTDTLFIDRLPEPVMRKIKPVQVGNSVKFTYKDESGQSQVINNARLEETFSNESFFQRAINRIKKAITKDQGLYDMLADFNSTYHMYLPSQGQKMLGMIIDKATKDYKIPVKKRIKEKEDLPF